MAVTTLAGVIDAGVYVVGYIPQGTDVGADFTTIIAKLNEAITLANTNETDIASLESADSNHDILIQANTDDLAAYEASNNAAVAVIDGRVDDLEAAAGFSTLTLDLGGTHEITLAQMAGNSVIEIRNEGAGVTPSVFMNVTGSVPSTISKTTIINNGYTGVIVYCGTTGTLTDWADGTTSGEGAELTLAIGESVTVYPIEEYGSGNLLWAMIAGKSYGDLA